MTAKVRKKYNKNEVQIITKSVEGRFLARIAAVEKERDHFKKTTCSI